MNTNFPGFGEEGEALVRAGYGENYDHERQRERILGQVKRFAAALDPQPE
jgi:hypothetical protein